MKSFTQALIVALLKEKMLTQKEMQTIAGGGKGAGSIESIKGTHNPENLENGLPKNRPAN